MSSQNTLKELAVSAISTAEDINDTIHVIIDYRVGICPSSVNKGEVTDTLLLRRKVFILRNALNDRSAEHDVAGITARICTTLENSGNISNRPFSCIVSSISETVL